ncbi:Alpha/beta hydrolase family protein [Pseudomonas delhiensis]|uniref:Alpha/beta hydrolase family protein n=1 Tax=Pseudomonas delhiensis TaxID=366289 RepID=A0A239LVX6_9PSED|nr:Alpha/beta hydrolase family protein [Pseudomonas delhiensis]SNT34018.1 Alpha/beta hydrolase family protein [Pseudomonas delhiensis]
MVLVHGAFADASSWNGVTRILGHDGYSVVAAANPLHGVASDGAYVANILASLNTPVVLVGHSYGGNVKALVYVAAFAPEAGESAADVPAARQRSRGSRRGARRMPGSRPDQPRMKASSDGVGLGGRHPVREAGTQWSLSWPSQTRLERPCPRRTNGSGRFIARPSGHCRIEVSFKVNAFPEGAA